MILMKQNYNRSIKLICVTCGSESFFVTDEKTGVITCKKCNRVYHGGKDELIGLNKSLINKELDAVKNEVKKDMVNDLNAILKKSGFKIK